MATSVSGWLFVVDDNGVVSYTQSTSNLSAFLPTGSQTSSADTNCTFLLSDPYVYANAHGDPGLTSYPSNWKIGTHCTGGDGGCDYYWVDLTVAQKTVYSCPSGGTLSGTTCTK